MRQFVWSCAAVVLILGVARAEPTAADKPKPESAAATTSSATAPEYVQQALQAEARGDNQERTRLLTKAWLSVPDLPEANWHMARVRMDSEWQPLANVVNQGASDPNDAKYRGLRDKAAGNPDALRALARWCRKERSPDRARLHFAQLLAANPADMELQREAVKELDLQQVDGEWITAEEANDRQQKSKAIGLALAKWRPKLKKLQELIDGDDFDRRDKAIEQLRLIDDPAIIPVLESLLPNAGERFQEEAVKRLAMFPQYEATVTLVRCAILSSFVNIRDDAAEALKQRPQHEYVPLLLAALVAPFKSQYQIAWDRNGTISYTHALLREGQSGNMLSLSHGLAKLRFTSQSIRKDDTVRVNPPEKAKSTTTAYAFGKSPADAFCEQLAEASLEALSKETQIRFANGMVDAQNQRIFRALETSTGQHLERQPLPWWKWWQGYNEYYWPRPTSYCYQSNVFDYHAYVTHITHTTGTRNYSCFLAGTPVRTQTGPAPIESIQPGDRVLAQDQDTGELAYKVVLTTTLRPPAKMLKVSVGGEDVVTTLGHPFWVSGHGWKMAKQLQPGDLLHGLGGAVPIEKVEPASDERAYNLVVDDFNTYFVGQAGLLVHDNEFRKPTRAIVPGLVAEDAPRRETDVAAIE